MSQFTIRMVEKYEQGYLTQPETAQLLVAKKHHELLQDIRDEMLYHAGYDFRITSFTTPTFAFRWKNKQGVEVLNVYTPRQLTMLDYLSKTEIYPEE